jgi:anti-sigma factor RsiW
MSAPRIGPANPGLDATTHPALDRLSFLADGDLPSKQGEEVLRHLRVCPACSDTLTFIESLGEDLRRLPVPPLSESVLVRVLAGAARRAADRTGSP